jgi:hypothetical protein
MAVKRQVFYSFHFDNDVMRVQMIRNMGVMEGDEPVSANEWEKLRKGGGIKKWIDDTMAYRSCVIVLIGAGTAGRPWIDYEIRKAWDDKKGLFGIYIHNINCPRSGRCNQGSNPFELVPLQNGMKLSQYVKCYNPNSNDAYNDIKSNIGGWIDTAIANKRA